MPRRSPLFVLFLTVFVDLIGFGIVLPLLPRYARDYQASPHEIGLLMASFSAMQFLVAPIWGRLSDRVGRRPVLMVGLFGSVLAYGLFAVADSLVLLFVSRIAAGVFGATIGTAQAYIADVTSPKERGRGMALIGAAFGIGFTLGPAIGGLTHQVHPAGPGLAAMSLSLVALAIAWRSLPEPPRHEARAERALLDTTALRHALRTPTVRLILGLQFLATFAFANFEGTLSLLTKVRWDYDTMHNTAAFSFVGFTLLVAQGVLVRRLMGRVGELNFAVLGSALLVLGLAGIALAWAEAALFAGLAVAVIGFAMITPSLSSLLSRRTPPELQGEVLGVGQSMLSLARILGPYAGNVLFGVAPVLPNGVGAALMVIGLAWAILLRRAPVPVAPGPSPVHVLGPEPGV